MKRKLGNKNQSVETEKKKDFYGHLDGEGPFLLQENLADRSPFSS